MDIWISIHYSQMANNLVKWWKTKFLNGYKQFSVECNDGKVSDTEELLGRFGTNDESDRLRATCTTPPLQSEVPSITPTPTPTENSQSSLPKKSTQNHLNFEEFSCDVSLENDNKKTGQDRQEFSFTLYDFDGHGKITKDDIAGLVTTIYEALGSSVKVPHYGSKTIKVKLTVSPDQRKHVSATIINNDEKTEEIRFKRDLNVTIREGTNEKRRYCKRQTRKSTKKHRCCKKHYEEEINEQDDNPFVSDDNTSECSSFTSDDENNEQKPKKNTRKCHKNNNSGYTIPNLFMRESNCNQNCINNNNSNNDDNNNNTDKLKVLKKRSGSLQRQELLEIIQANMDKNNLSFQTTRKHSNHISTENKIELHKHHNKLEKITTSPLQYLANIVNPTHFYVDLASLQNTTKFPQNCQYDKLIDAVMCVSNKKNLKTNKYKKSRTKVDLSKLPFRYQLLDCPLNEEKNKPNKKITVKKNERSLKKSAQIVTGHTSSTHHLKHRNRQEDQARAMAQVVRWLEQEFSSNLNTKDKDKTKSNHQSNKDKHTGNGTPSTPSNGGVERHEHHHVHEHIHHHYHHYQDTPLVV